MHWEDRITLYVGYLIHNKKQSSTVKSYLSAIQAVLKMEGIKINEDQFLLSLLTRACKVENDRIRHRFPIRKGLLMILLRDLGLTYKDQLYLLATYQALFSTAYFGLLRVGELTSGTHPILARDVHLANNKNKILFILYLSKTHDKSQHPQMVKISSRKQNDPTKNYRKQELTYCPYNLLRKYIQVRGPYSTKNLEEPFFVFSDHSAITPQVMRSVLKCTLKWTGFNETLYDTHSFRIGRTVDLLKLGLSVETIKKIGRWKSNAVFTYLHQH